MARWSWVEAVSRVHPVANGGKCTRTRGIHSHRFRAGVNYFFH